MNRWTYLSLFSGIGGFDLGLDRAGWRGVGQVESCKKCRAILRQWWPDVPRFKRVETTTKEDFRGQKIRLICGGFPCQDISNAFTTVKGKGREGLSGDRGKLWFEFLRLIREIGPRWVMVENSSALTVRGLPVILSGLAQCGYDAEWSCVSAAGVGAPHLRKRMFIVGWSREVFSHAYGKGLPWKVGGLLAQPCPRRQDADTTRPNWRETTPRILGRGHGVPDSTHRITALGNAIIPQIPEMIGRRVMELDRWWLESN